MYKNFKVVLEYDGTRYHGWQRQPNDTTVQQEVEHAIATIVRQTVTLVGSGRTDAGVHAFGQVANFQCTTRIGPDEMMRGLNSLLPDDIVVRKCCLAARDFHARFAAKSKRYRYHIANRPLRPAIGRNHCWWIRRPLDAQAMQTAAACLIGEHDFKGFEGSGSPRSHTVRTVMEAVVERKTDDAVHFTIRADGFLRYMVRNIIGSLVAVGHHKMEIDAFQQILLSRDRSRAAATAPPQGLFLLEVFY